MRTRPREFEFGRSGSRERIFPPRRTHGQGDAKDPAVHGPEDDRADGRGAECTTSISTQLLLRK